MLFHSRWSTARLSLTTMILSLVALILGLSYAVHHELFTDEDFPKVITEGVQTDLKLKEMLGADWREVLCPDWRIGKLANEDAAWEAKTKMYQNHVDVDEVIQLLEKRETHFDQIGTIWEHDCVYHALTILSGDLSWVKWRAKLLWQSGHVYESALMYLFGRVQPWTPFRFVGKTNITAKEIVADFADEAWAMVASHMTAWSLTWAASFMQNPHSAKLRALELGSYCEIPTDYAGHPANTDLHHIPNRYLHTWLSRCIQRAIPDMQELGADINKGYDAENVFHEVGLLGNGSPFPADSYYKGVTPTMALLAAGADPRIIDHSGYNVLHVSTFWAAKMVLFDLHEFEKGKYWQDLVTAKDMFGRTAHDLACEAKWVVNGLGEKAMNLLGGPCAPTAALFNETRESYCMGNEAELGEDTSACILPTPEQEAGFHDTQRCDLEVWDAAVKDFNMYDFIKHYMSLQRPVVIRNAFKAAPNANLDYIREHYSDAKFTQVSVPYSEKYGRKTRQETRVGDFLNTCMHPDPKQRQNKSCSADKTGYYQDYIFEVPKKNIEDNDAIRQIFVDNLVEFIDFSYDAKRDGVGSYLGCPQFYSGPDRSGSQMHTHIMAHNMLFQGQKFWWFLSPLLSFTSNIHAIQWRDEMVSEQEGILTCTQFAGDIFFAPTHWGHGLINQADSFGYACEFEWTPWYTDNVLPWAMSLRPQENASSAESQTSR
eukprot:gb/GEZN01001631.1/.p1 GENE.gb/GEZN01001631.1/~~gb/GEZN01001631.1/.p1  ORF type:complete len:713 (-),score=85.79 gb/GEZN01001631.1/:695-2833(-)